MYERNNSARERRKKEQKKKKINVGQGKLICKHFGRETE